MVQHNTQLNPQQIFLKSNEGISNNSTKKSSISFELKNHITIPTNIDAYIQLNSYKFVNSFYNINTTNNIFYYSTSTIGIGIINNISIDIGNYNITTLIDFLNTSLTGIMSFTYNQSTFKIKIIVNSGTMIIRNGVNNCLKVLGFNNVDTIETNELTSPNLINLTGSNIIFNITKFYNQFKFK